jgi:hypothetical protein
MHSKNISIEVLYFSDCPSWKVTVKDLKEVLNELEIKAKILLTEIQTNAEAEKNRFPGSPTIRVNGQDLFPGTQFRYALQCRVYQTPNGLKGFPSRGMIKDQISSLLN